jgi:hypothetical protein
MNAGFTLARADLIVARMTHYQSFTNRYPCPARPVPQRGEAVRASEAEGQSAKLIALPTAQNDNRPDAEVQMTEFYLPR